MIAIKSNRKIRALSLLLILVLGLVLVGCTKPTDNTEDDKKYTVDDLDTKYTDNLKLKSDFTNKLFLKDGIEEVRLLRVVDGDTAHFFDKNNNTIKVRLLGINTPESTGSIAPWGKQASVFLKGKLQNASSIVIEAEDLGKAPETDTSGDRYLAYVWYKTNPNDDYRLVNLEIIENCFSYFTGEETKLKYGTVMKDAYIEKSKMGLRVFGEKDPNYDYDNTVNEITIAQLRNNYSSYSTGTKLKLTVRVVRLVGRSLYVEDIEDTYDEDTKTTSRAGIFVYHSFASGTNTLKPGDVIQFECQASDDETYGKQLVNPSKIKLLESNTNYVIQEIPDSVTSLEAYEGFVVKVKNFTVTDKSIENNSGAYTVYGKMQNGAPLQIRIDADLSPSVGYDVFVIGKTYNIIGGVSKYVNVYENNKVYYQLKVGNYTPQFRNDIELVK